MKRTVGLSLLIMLFPFYSMAQEDGDLEMISVANLNVEAPTNIKPKGVYIIDDNIQPPIQIKTYVDNVTRDEAERARRFFKQANKKFEERQLQEALILYKKAYAIWPHPRILFNMGVTLALMGRPLEAALMFKMVLEYGPDPVTPSRYKEARDKYLELMGTLAVLQVKCTTEGAEVFVDTLSLGRCPFTKRITLTAGRHLVTAKAKGFVPFSRDIVLPARKVAGLDIEMKAMTQVMKMKKVERYPISWALTAAIGGLVVLGGGSALYYYGRSEIDAILLDIDHYVAGRQSPPAFDTSVYDPVREDRAVLMQKVGVAAMAVGGVAVLTGTYFYLFRYKMVPIMVTTGGEGTEGAAFGVSMSF